MKFFGIKQDGKLVHPPVIAEEKRKYWNRIPDGVEVESSLTVKRRSKSQSQLGAIWGLMLSQTVSELYDRGYDTSFIYKLEIPTGIPIDKDDLCQFFYNACPIRNENGKIITLSKTDTIQAAKFFDDVRSWLSTQWGIVVPEPDPNWKTKGEQNGH